MCPNNKYAPQILHKWQLLHVHFWDNYISIYTSYEFSAMSIVTRRTDIHAFHITGICPWTNKPPHCTYMYQCPVTVVYIQTPHYHTYLSKIHKLHHLPTKLLQSMCQKQICPSNATYMPHIPIISCAYMKQLCQYIYLIWTHSNWYCDQNHWYSCISYHWHMPLRNIPPHCM